LVSKDATTQELRKIVTDLRERIEIVHNGNYLKYLFPAFRYLLEKRIKPQIHFGTKKRINPKEGKVLNQVRHVVLEILDRIPINQAWVPISDKLLTVTINQLFEDNQDNALVCLKIIFNIFKYHNANRSYDSHSEVEHNVERFLRFTQKLYKNLKHTKLYTFQQRANGKLPSTTTDNQMLKSLGVPSSLSFKVVTECPKIVMLIFKSHTSLIPQYMPQFIPQMLEAVSLKATPEAFTDIRLYTPRLAEMIACQVKTLSFLTYLLKGFATKMREYMYTLAEAVIHLFRNCPADAVDTTMRLIRVGSY
jgi:transformation/transcription domain-associated protein